MNRPDSSLAIKIIHDQPTIMKPVAYIPGCISMIDSYGCTIPQIVPYIPDLRSLENQASACIHRFGCEMPVPQRESIQEFREFSQIFIRENFVKLREEDVLSFQEWLDGSKYNSRQKAEFTRLRNTINRRLGKHKGLFAHESSSFIKFEGYMKPDKFPRAINSPTDLVKTLLGPIIKSIEKSTFKHSWFVKGSNPRDWPLMLEELFGASPVMETDFSSFEAHHRGIFAEIVRYWMMHMLHDLRGISWLKRLLCRMVSGVNHTRFSTVECEVDQRLMSGVAWTSASNGVLNLLIMSYLSMKTLHPEYTPLQLALAAATEFRGRVEGDDGICLDVGVSQELIDSLGLKLKFDCVRHFAQASFCGIVADPLSLTVVTDPLKVIANFFVLEAKAKTYKTGNQMALLRAKALSYAVSYTDCPIIGELAHKVLELTRSITVQQRHSESSWKSDLLTQAMKEKVWLRKPHVPDSSRVVVQDRFGIPISRQIEIEAGIRKGLIVDIMDLVPRHFDRHIFENVIDPLFEYPEKGSCKEFMKHFRVVCGRQLQEKKHRHFEADVPQLLS